MRIHVAQTTFLNSTIILSFISYLHSRAIMRYHGIKMAEINKIIKEYWINTYKGNGKNT